VNVAINIILGNSFHDAACAFDMNVIECEVPGKSAVVGCLQQSGLLCLIVTPNQVVYSIGMSDTLLDGLCVTKIHFL